MGHKIREFVITLLIGITTYAIGQEDTCRRCYGEFRFGPHIIDIVIATSDNNNGNATIYWNDPLCCNVHYQVDVLQMSSQDSCNTVMTNTSENTITFNNTMLSDCELCIFQISAIYSDDVVTPGPCQLVNVTSFIPNSRTYPVAKYAAVDIPIVFESCQTFGTFVTPSYEINGNVIYGSDLQAYVTFRDDEYFFTISNITEDTVLLEYCALTPVSEVICDICENLQQDKFLSRTKILIVTDVTDSEDTTMPNTTGPETVTDVTCCNTTASAGSSKAQPVLSPVFLIIITFISLVLMK